VKAAFLVGSVVWSMEETLKTGWKYTAATCSGLSSANTPLLFLLILKKCG